MDCAYCVLQTYFHPPVLKFFVNHDDLFSELEHFLSRNKNGICRIGTGEFTDSLIWENLSGLSARLVERFGRQENAVLELKTKTINVSGLAGLAHGKKTILAWSLNTPAVIRNEERGTTSLEERLAAAALCRSWGYPLAFHFDPIVLYPGCEKEYENTVRELFRAVPPEAVVWISLGTLRFSPDLKPVISRRFPGSRLVCGEFISGKDRKMRYFKPLRVAFYKRLAAVFRELAPEVPVYFCMEDEDVWEKSLGFSPRERGGLGAMLDESAARHCGLSSAARVSGGGS
jgi:spore photoproduct lyase